MTTPEEIKAALERGIEVREFLALCDGIVDHPPWLAEAIAKAKEPSTSIDWNRVREAESAYARGETTVFLSRECLESLADKCPPPDSFWEETDNPFAEKE